MGNSFQASRGLLAACLAASLFGGVAVAAPITFNTALPVASGEFVSRLQYVRARSGHDPGDLDRNRTVQSVVGVVGYGATPKLALFGVLPYVDKELDLKPGDRRRHRSANGMGDASLFARYTLLQRDEMGSTLRLAPYLGVKAPTGSDDRSDGQGRLPPAVQPGSGSWDGFGGLVLTWQTLDYQVDAQVAYRANSEANDYRAGNQLRADGSLQYRLLPRTLGPGVPGFLYGVLEANLVYTDKDRVHGRRDPDSGGTRLFLAPGIQYVTRRFILETALQWPLLQQLNGDALEAGPIVRAGFRVNF